MIALGDVSADEAAGLAPFEGAHERILHAENDVRIEVFVAVDEQMRDQRATARRSDHEVHMRRPIGMAACALIMRPTGHRAGSDKVRDDRREVELALAIRLEAARMARSPPWS